MASYLTLTAVDAATPASVSLDDRIVPVSSSQRNAPARTTRFNGLNARPRATIMGDGVDVIRLSGAYTIEATADLRPFAALVAYREAGIRVSLSGSFMRYPSTAQWLVKDVIENAVVFGEGGIPHVVEWTLELETAN